MSSTNDNDSCLSDPNFAVICSFLQHYADILNIKNPTFKELREMIENKNDVATDLVDTIVRLLRKSNFKVDKDKWERRLSKFCATYSTGDADEIIRLGFKNMKTSVKLRIMKELLEYQFDQNTVFKNIVNELTPDKQRYQPLIQDNCGHLYWTMTDANDDAMVYEEDSDHKSWNVVAHDRDELIKIVKPLVPQPSPAARRPSLSVNTIRTSSRLSVAAERRAVEREEERKAEEREAAERLMEKHLMKQRLMEERLKKKRLSAGRLSSDYTMNVAVRASSRLSVERLTAERLAAERLAAERLAAERLAAEHLSEVRLSSGNTANVKRRFEVKKLLNDFCVSIGRMNEIDSES